MNIVPTPKSGKWSDAAATIDFNNSKINLELLKLKNATSKNFGYFESLALLTAAYPAPSIGDVAFCGTTYPGVVYDCIVAGTWHSTGVTAVDLFKNNDYINITVNFPLGSGYYTLASAIAAVTTDLKQLGLVITFAVSETEWQTWQFESDLISGWNTLTNWTMLINTKHQITLEKIIAEALNVLYGKINSIDDFLSKMIFDSFQADSVNIVKAFNLYGSTNLILSGSVAPTVAPDFVGQKYIKTISPKALYTATGIGAASDWEPDQKLDSIVEVCIDFKVVEAFIYNVPKAMKLTSMTCESTNATLSIALNTNMAQFTKLTITPAVVGLVILKGELI